MISFKKKKGVHYDVLKCLFVFVCKINKIRWQEAIRKSEPIGKNKKTIRQTKSTNYYSEPFCFACTNEAGANFILITKQKHVTIILHEALMLLA